MRCKECGQKTEVKKDSYSLQDIRNLLAIDSEMNVTTITLTKEDADGIFNAFSEMEYDFRIATIRDFVTADIRIKKRGWLGSK